MKILLRNQASKKWQAVELADNQANHRLQMLARFTAGVNPVLKPPGFEAI